MSVEIPVSVRQGETVFLICDENNYIIARKIKRVRQGVTTDELVGCKFFGSLPAALNRLLDMRIQKSDVTTLLELKDLVEKTRAELFPILQASAEPSHGHFIG